MNRRTRRPGRTAALAVSAAALSLTALQCSDPTPRTHSAPTVALTASAIPGYQPATYRPPSSHTITGLVDVYSRMPGATAAGTGIVLNPDGEVVTNNHVITGATAITATDPTTGRTYTAVVLGADPRHDVAILQLQDADGLTPAVLSDSSTVEIGDHVEAAGNAGGRGGTPTITAGQVTGLRKSVIAQDEYRHQQHRLTGMIEVNAAVAPGDSGGPLFGDHGVIGMDTAAVSGGSGFAIPINTVLSTVRRLESSDSAGSEPQERTLQSGSSAVSVRPILAIG